MLLDPYRSAALDLPNRIVMAPMTRTRGDDATGEARPLMATYYAQRAGAGLIVSEGLWPHPSGKGERGVPGLATTAQADSWRPVTEAVHVAGGRIVAQLWHVGRVTHPANLDGGLVPVAPSAVSDERVTVRTPAGRRPHGAPVALTAAGVQELVEAFAGAAVRAVAAGFDGVEVHGANGYLVHQFLADNTNLRTDAHGERIRFAVEVVEAVAAAVGGDRTGLRISPDNPENGLVERDPATTYRALLDAVAPLDLAYLHVVERGRYPALRDLRRRWRGTLVGNYNGPAPTTVAEGEQALASGLADLFSFGRLFVTNPDLPARIAAGADLVLPDRRMYGTGPAGYTDQPSLAAVVPDPCPR